MKKQNFFRTFTPPHVNKSLFFRVLQLCVFSLLAFSIVFLINACNKEELIQKEELIGLRVSGTLLEGKGHFTNGMIEFNSVEAFYQLKDLLKQFSNDSLKTAEAYSELGYDTLFDKDAHITMEPVLEKFEKSLNFTSARKKEESDFFTFLNQGNEPSDFKRHWILDPYVKTLLNTNNEIKIGTRIFKHIDDENILMVGNSDFVAYNAVKNLPVENIGNHYNVRILKMSEYSDQDFFTYDSQDRKIGFTPVTDIDFEVHQLSDNLFSINNNSFIDYGDVPYIPEYKWSFSDGISFIGIVPPNYTLKEPIVKLNLIAKVRNSKIIEDHEEATIAKCFHTFKVTRLDDCSVTYTSEFVGEFGPDAIYVWNFGDGSPNGYGPSFTHTYDQPGEYTITGWVYQIIDGVRSLRCILETEVNGICCTFPIPDNLISIDGGNVMFNIYSLQGINQAHHIGIKWGDGTKEMFYYPSFSFSYYNYKKSGEYKIEVAYYDSTGKAYCWGEITISIFICNEQNYLDKEINSYIDGRWYQLYCFIWVTKSTPYSDFTAGSYSKTFRKGNLTGQWWQYKVDKIWCGNGGFYLQKKYVGTPSKKKCVKIDVEYAEDSEGNSGFVGREFRGDNYKEPYKFWSTHRAKVNGVEWSYPGKFYLH